MSGGPRLVAVVDCGLGNIHSLLGCLRRLVPADEVRFTAEPAVIAAASHVILPGDGAFGACLAEIDARGLRAALVTAARTKPFFGICVGMQALYQASDEDPGAGLGILDGTVTRFPAPPHAKVPLMGWLDVTAVGTVDAVFAGVGTGTRFYFLHSFHADAAGAHVALVAEHTCRFAAAVAHGRLCATQFHPEKSGAAGVALLERFLAS